MAEIIEIRKYPNRRYYNTRESRHVTLEEIRDLVRDGHEIRVVDSRTDTDITVAVLTQILLEIESPKLALFPASFLQHLIRLNSDVFKSMSETYFRNSFAAFMKSAEAAQAGAAGGFGAPFAHAMGDWQRMWFGGAPTDAARSPTEAESPGPGEVNGTAREDKIEALSRQIEDMRRVLAELQKKRPK